MDGGNKKTGEGEEIIRRGENKEKKKDEGEGRWRWKKTQENKEGRKEIGVD